MLVGAALYSVFLQFMLLIIVFEKPKNPTTEGEYHFDQYYHDCDNCSEQATQECHMGVVLIALSDSGTKPEPVPPKPRRAKKRYTEDDMEIFIYSIQTSHR